MRFRLFVLRCDMETFEVRSRGGLGYISRMTKAMDWLINNAPGFQNLSTEERDAITDFSLLWSLFESRILNTRASVQSICNTVNDWHASGTIEPALFDEAVKYFRERYHPGNSFTHYFDGLRLRNNDRPVMVRAVLSGTDDDTCHRAATALIVIYRYRNNLFHGVKWHYELAGQLSNFNAANMLLMKVLERHGRLS